MPTGMSPDWRLAVQIRVFWWPKAGCWLLGTGGAIMAGGPFAGDLWVRLGRCRPGLPRMFRRASGSGSGQGGQDGAGGPEGSGAGGGGEGEAADRADGGADIFGDGQCGLVGGAAAMS